MLRIDRMSRRASSSRALLIALVAIAFIAANAYSYAQGPGGRGQGRQGGQNGNWGGRGQGGQGGQNGNWGGRGQGGQGGQNGNWGGRGQGGQDGQNGNWGGRGQGRQGGQNGNWGGRGQGGQGGQNGNWGGRGQGGQGGQNGNWGGRGQGGQGGRGGQNGAWGGRGQDGQNPFSAEQISQRMTRDGFERLRSNPAWADRVKGIVGEDRWAQWERGDFSSGASAAAQAAAAAEGRPVDGNLSDAERAEAEALLRTGSVPDFRNPDQPYSLEAENAYYQRALAQRDDSLVSSVPLSIRTYSRFFVTKYDKNGDGMLQRAEWEDKVNGAQAIDIDGDWTLTDQEIMYYLARFSQGRTLSNPNPSQTPTPRVNAVVEATETPLLIRTASAAPRRMTRSEFDEEREQLLQGDLAELSDEDFIKLMTEDNPALESVEDEELLGVLLADMDESNYREYTTPPQVMVGVPVWFLARDVNGDGQLTLLEFAPSLLPSAVAQFGKFDANADGLITAEEIREAQKKAKPAE